MFVVAQAACVAAAAAEEYGLQMMPNSAEEGPSGSEAPAPVPMLHMWVDVEMTLHAVRQSMHNFVAAPQGQQWQLSLAKVGPGTKALLSITMLSGARLPSEYYDSAK